uniref:Ankyrin repeat protein n=1 Tax=viral metagenome TaxID=1070528 RepID=A0A6C0ACR2_9ZZZZ
MNTTQLSDFIIQNNSYTEDIGQDYKYKKIKLVKNIKNPVEQLEQCFVNLTTKGFCNRAYYLWKVSKDNGLYLDTTALDNLALMNACRVGYIDFIDWYLKLNKKLNLSVKLKDNLFYEACINDKLEVVTFLCENILKDHVIRIDKNNHELFKTVCKNNCIKVAKWLTYYYPKYSVNIENNKIIFGEIINSMPDSKDIIPVKSSENNDSPTSLGVLRNLEEASFNKNEFEEDNTSVFSDINEYSQERQELKKKWNKVLDELDFNFAVNNYPPDFEDFSDWSETSSVYSDFQPGIGMDYNSELEFHHNYNNVVNEIKTIFKPNIYVPFFEFYQEFNEVLDELKQVTKRPPTPHVKKFIENNHTIIDMGLDYWNTPSYNNSFNYHYDKLSNFSDSAKTVSTCFDLNVVDNTRHNPTPEDFGFPEYQRSVSAPILNNSNSSSDFGDYVEANPFKTEMNESSLLYTDTDTDTYVDIDEYTDSVYSDITAPSQISNLLDDEQINDIKYDKEQDILNIVDQALISNEHLLNDKCLKIYIEDHYTLCTLIGYDLPKLKPGQILVEDDLCLGEYETTYMKSLYKTLEKNDKCVLPIPWIGFGPSQRDTPFAFVTNDYDYCVKEGSFDNSKELYLYTALASGNLDFDQEILDIFIKNEIGINRWESLNDKEKNQEIDLLLPTIDIVNRLYKYGYSKIETFVNFFTDEFIEEIKNDAKLKKIDDLVYEHGFDESDVIHYVHTYGTDKLVLDKLQEIIKKYIPNYKILSVCQELLDNYKLDEFVMNTLKSIYNLDLINYNLDLINNASEFFLKNTNLLNFFTEEEIIKRFTYFNNFNEYSKEKVYKILSDLENLEENKRMIVVVLLSKEYQRRQRIEKYFFWSSLDYSIIENHNLLQICKYVEALNVIGLNYVFKPELNPEHLILENYFYDWFVLKYCYVPPVPELLKHKQD